ncbi:MAG TPA: tRNA epoxyqueuosine(34) reductase QueG [Terriglobia bacterium]|nr:tRNA epoxyqueuosine(34) reductase QueG [Terriglobia bacterium]
MMLRSLVKQRAREIGFDLVGISPVDAYDGLKFSREWVKRGFGGEMRYLENPKRDDPRLVLPSAKSVICVSLIYNAPLPYSVEVDKTGSRESGVGSREKNGIESSGHQAIEPLKEKESSNGSMVRSLNGTVLLDDGPRGWISRYAWGTDYHKVMRSKLEQLRRAVEALAPGVETRGYVDTGPVVERAFARLSGIGWAGKNTCLINEAKGSWFFLGVMLTSLALDPDLPAPDRCGTCTACIEACPTQALVEPYVMDASRCIAYFNIELKGAIPEEFRPAIGSNVVGCDICQDVCPWNGKGRSQESEVRSQNEEGGRSVATTSQAEFQPMKVNVERGFAHAESLTPNPEPLTFSLFNPPLEALASLNENDFRRIFQKSPIKRVKYRGWLRNLCVAMGNSGDSKFLPRLRYFREHSDPIVREHAKWAILQILKTKSLAAEIHPQRVPCPS